MLHSLRGRIIGALVGVILLASLLNGALAVWSTTSRFNLHVTEEGRWRAQIIAGMLESQLPYEQDELDMTWLFARQERPQPEQDAQYEEQQGDFDQEDQGQPQGPDCLAISAIVLNMPTATLEQELAQNQSVAEIARRKGVDPTLIVSTIVDTDSQNGGDMALPPQERQRRAAGIVGYARSFVYTKHPPSLASSAELSPVMFMARSQGLMAEGERLLVANTSGRVAYDSSGAQTGQQLPSGLLEQGVPLWQLARNQPLGTVIITTAPGVYTEQQAVFLSGVSQSLLISGLIAAALAIVLGIQLARRISRPVSELTQGLRRLSSGDRSLRLSISAKDEVGEMGRAFNSMAEALQTQTMLRNRLVDDLMHELNTPLSVIQLELEAMRDGMQSPAQATEQVQREISLLRNLINDLVVLAESEPDTEPRATELIDMRELVEQAVERWRVNAEAKGVRLSVDLGGAPLPVSVDALRMAQVLGNLLSNALRHTEQGGQISIACRLAQREAMPSEQAARMLPAGMPAAILTTIADTGCGIAEVDLPFVFERFYKADRARTRARGGRGLGLAIVRQLVERHQGRVWADSVPRAGSTFGFSLPSAG